MASLAMNSCRVLLRSRSLLLAVHPIDRRIAERAVRKARRVPHQIADRDFPLGRDRLVFRTDVNAKPLQFGNVLRDRLVELELALLPQHHGGDRGDRLGHRINAEDRVGLHRPALGQVHHSDRLPIDDFAVAGHRRDGPGKLFFLDHFLDDLVGTFEFGLLDIPTLAGRRLRQFSPPEAQTAASKTNVQQTRHEGGSS